jgi:hypothetical protein
MLSLISSAQRTGICNPVKRVLESGEKENFESLSMAFEQKSWLVPVPNAGIKIPGFPVNYVDRKNHFTAKTNLSGTKERMLDSLYVKSAELDTCINYEPWTVTETFEDQSDTDFREVFTRKYRSETMELRLSVDSVAANVFTVNLRAMRRLKGR